MCRGCYFIFMCTMFVSKTKCTRGIFIIYKIISVKPNPSMFNFVDKNEQFHLIFHAKLFLFIKVFFTYKAYIKKVNKFNEISAKIICEKIF